ncbi:hypothetical protein EOA13_07245 [Mesorhizobium sp. M7A.F.Ca.US.011.01.1.1]|nr:hypothetical protein EOA13_07245 [Mesorhizobium sp. M7A.F.Ca.US.011.01.1.1]
MGARGGFRTRAARVSSLAAEQAPSVSGWSSTARRLFRGSSFASHATAIGETANDSLLLPVTIRGEVPGRAMRGGADQAGCRSQKI